MYIAENPRHAGIQRPRATEDTGQRVVVALWHWVELMIVAASAAHGHAQDRPPEGVELVVDDVHLQLQLVLVNQGPRPNGQKPGGDDLLAALGIALGFQDIAGNLFTDEPVVRFVPVERVDHVVAIPPSVLRGNPPSEPQSVRIARQVEPVPTPSLPERRRR